MLTERTRVKAVLSTLNSRYIHAATAPYCLLSGIRAYAKSEVEATVLEATVHEDIARLSERILSASPTLLALSVYIWNRRESAELVRLLKARTPSLYIVAGGPEVAFDAAAFLTECPVDAVLLGEGERQIAELCDILAAGGDITTLPGSVTRGQDGVCERPPSPPEEVPPSAVLPEYLASLKGRIAYLETSRGCPFSCTFCLSGREGCGVRFFPEERVRRELLSLATSGARTVKLVDRTFNANRRRARELWRFLIDEAGRGILRGISFHFEVAASLLTDEDVALLATAPRGLIRLELGIQSFHEPTLRAIRRTGDILRVEERIRELTALPNLEIHIDLIAGLPHETPDSFASGFERAYALSPSLLQLGFLKVLHGTALRDAGLLFGSEPPYEVTETETMSREDLRLLHAAEGALERLYNSHRFPRTLSYLFGEGGCTPFAFFSGFGKTVPPHGTSFLSYVDALYCYASAEPLVSPAVLRDTLLYDVMTRVPNHIVPKSIYIPDKRLSEVKKTIQKEYRASGYLGRLGIAHLITRGELLVVRYDAEAGEDGCYPHEVRKFP